MARRVFASFAVVLVMMLMMEGWGSVAAISCGEVIIALTPCLKYAVGREKTVPRLCCIGVRLVADASKADADLQAACQCVQHIVATVPGLREDLVNSIPAKCGVSIPFKLSPSLDCSKVHW